MITCGWLWQVEVAHVSHLGISHIHSCCCLVSISSIHYHKLMIYVYITWCWVLPYLIIDAWHWSCCWCWQPNCHVTTCCSLYWIMTLILILNVDGVYIIVHWMRPIGIYNNISTQEQDTKYFHTCACVVHCALLLYNREGAVWWYNDTEVLCCVVVLWPLAAPVWIYYK